MEDFETLADLINYIRHEILFDKKWDSNPVLKMSFENDCILMLVSDEEFPIRINIQGLVSEDSLIPQLMVRAELDIELCRNNIGEGWLANLDIICHLIDNNSKLFRPLLENNKIKEGRM